MNNEPVAYWDGKHFASKNKSSLADIPLYTHPVKEQDESFDRTASHMAGEYVSYPVKELTDEEILQVMINVYSDTVPPIRGVEFARAILRKASEK